jgi:hypothetical protein
VVQRQKHTAHQEHRTAQSKGKRCLLCILVVCGCLRLVDP